MSEVVPVAILTPDGVVAAAAAVGVPAAAALVDARPRADDDAYVLPPDALPVVNELRARPGTLVVGAADAGPRWTVRVEVPEVWDVVRLAAAANTPVREVKRAALDALLSGTATVDDYVVKLNGATVLDEMASMTTAGALDGSIFLITHRRRRPVR
ncbi:MAG: hypothetical protein M3154_04315 [Candidatus Eremiobacteraeota bacterium]|nr:hypothetical protein [Candidatus Eremiobacteraeota bacterium]